MRTGALASFLLAGCAHLAGPLPTPITVPGGRVTVSVESSANRGDLPELASVATEALPPLDRWGGLRVATRIVVLPDHAALEKRIDHPGYDWLRAWARYDVIYLQAPGTWYPLGIPPGRGQLRAILTHELTHCAMYQAISDGTDWVQRDIPLWFKEGMASWTAHQEDRRMSEKELSRFLEAHPEVDPLSGADSIYRQDEALVYSAGHWAFDRLAASGAERINALLSQMRGGVPFARAFELAFGETPEIFEARALDHWRHSAVVGSR